MWAADRWRMRMALLSDVGTLATQALAARGLTWGRVGGALLALTMWAAFAVAALWCLLTWWG